MPRSSSRSLTDSGDVQWDQRFTSSEKDTNIECHGIQTVERDGGYILTCGTGVEPEVHPHDSDKSKTWRVLVHRTDSEGAMLWQDVYTSNDKLQNNAGEYIIATRNDDGYAVLWTPNPGVPAVLVVTLPSCDWTRIFLLNFITNYNDHLSTTTSGCKSYYLTLCPQPLLLFDRFFQSGFNAKAPKIRKDTSLEKNGKIHKGRGTRSNPIHS